MIIFVLATTIYILIYRNVNKNNWFLTFDPKLFLFCVCVCNIYYCISSSKDCIIIITLSSFMNIFSSCTYVVVIYWYCQPSWSTFIKVFFFESRLFFSRWKFEINHHHHQPYCISFTSWKKISSFNQETKKHHRNGKCSGNFYFLWIAIDCYIWLSLYLVFFFFIIIKKIKTQYLYPKNFFFLWFSFHALSKRERYSYFFYHHHH